MMLTARQLSFGYEEKPVFHHIDLCVEPGKITVLTGPSGAGKTTLLRCLALLEHPRAGAIHVDDDVFSFPRKPGARPAPPWPKLTAVFQQLFLWPHLTLRENILLPARCRRVRDAQAMLEKLAGSFDMGAFMDRYPNEASLGQRQRAALARALILKPRYLLLDEITSALDVEQISRILGHLKSLRDSGTGLFIVTHLLGFARDAADRVLFLDQGAIIESGGADILRAPKSARLKKFLSMVSAAA